MGRVPGAGAVLRRVADIRTAVAGTYFAARCALLGPDRWPGDTFGAASHPTWLWLNTEGRRRFRSVARALPALPTEDEQRRITGETGDRCLVEAARFHEVLSRSASRFGVPLSQARVLDFGCGWGRITQFLAKDVRPDRLAGIDPNGASVEECRSRLPWAAFFESDPLPPTSFPDGSFDVVYAYSVFSHLSEDYQRAWLAEFHRLLAPGGIVVMTTRSRSFFDEAASVRADPGSTKKPGARQHVFVDTARWKAAYDRGEFCHDAGPAQPAGYGETCIPRQYVVEQWQPWFQLLDYLDVGMPQNVIVARRIAGHESADARVAMTRTASTDP